MHFLRAHRLGRGADNFALREHRPERKPDSGKAAGANVVGMHRFAVIGFCGAAVFREHGARALLRRGETLPLDDRDDAELAVALESTLESRELIAQIMALPPPDGELFLRRYLYGETAAQLGAAFDMPAATVRTRLHRARLALQKLLKEV